MELVLAAWDCHECGENIQKQCMPDCEECGRGIGEEELFMTLQGYDVVGLFPAMKSKTTGEIIRKFIINSEVQVKGFSWQQGARYIAMNKHLTGELEAVNKFLPWKKSKKKVTMKNKGINKRKENLAWQFRDTKPNEGEIRQILARVAEIGAEYYGSTSATGLLTRSTTSRMEDRSGPGPQWQHLPLS